MSLDGRKSLKMVSYLTLLHSPETDSCEVLYEIAIVNKYYEHLPKFSDHPLLK